MKYRVKASHWHHTTFYEHGKDTVTPSTLSCHKQWLLASSRLHPMLPEKSAHAMVETEPYLWWDQNKHRVGQKLCTLFVWINLMDYRVYFLKVQNLVKCSEQFKDPCDHSTIQFLESNQDCQPQRVTSAAHSSGHTTWVKRGNREK